MPKNKLSIFLFHRDLRLQDNTGLDLALKESSEVLPVFIFDGRQIEPHPYRSLPGLQFMLESLEELDLRLRKFGSRLYLFSGRSDEVISRIILESGASAVFSNRDYTPFAKNRDSEIKASAEKAGAKFYQFGDALLVEPEAGLKGDGTPYTVFTPFFKKNSQTKVRPPAPNPSGKFFNGDITGEGPELLKSILPTRSESLAPKGGRTAAKGILKALNKFSKYSDERDFPALSATTNLSPHLKFGTVSPREVYSAVVSALGISHDIIRQLYWRDFFTHIAFHFPHVFGHSFHPIYDKIEWVNDNADFLSWCSGATGYPIVDAGMRELNTTGLMHNRVRMITASFLIKDLHIDWRWGERYFAQKLIDYDPAVNNGSWQWVASTGCDAQPYFRIFNPWLQQEKFDPEAIYIKRWIPELSGAPKKVIHDPSESARDGYDYPRPMVNHAEAKSKTEELYDNARSRE